MNLAAWNSRRSVPLFLVCVGLAGWVPMPSAAQKPMPADSPLPAPRTVGPAVPAASAAPVEEAAPPPREVLEPAATVGEEAAPMPREQTPPPPRLVLPSEARLAAPMVEVQRLHHELEALRIEREAMLIEEMDLLTAKELKAGKTDGLSLLRRRVTDLVAKAVQKRKTEPSAPNARDKTPSSQLHPSEEARTPSASKTTTPAKNPTTTTKPAHSSEQPKESVAHPLTDAPVDPMSLAQALFLSGDYASALKAYRQLEEEEQRGDQRITLQYLIACCLRKLGKLDEATTLYREVANSRGSDFLVESSQWYLRAMKERRGLEGQLTELRQRRQALNPRKP